MNQRLVWIPATWLVATPLALGQDRPDVPVDAPYPGPGTQVGASVRLDEGGGPSPSNETSVAVSPAHPMHFVAAWNDYREGAPRVGVGLSLDGGVTWTDRVLRPPLPYQSATEADPMTAADPRTGALWVGGVSFGPNGGVFVARKDPGSADFEPAVMAYPGGGADKALMAAGPDPVLPRERSVVYVTFNQGLIHSDDMGATWSQPLPLESGLGFVPRVGPSGALYIAYWDNLDGVRLMRSLDGGETLEPSRLIAQRLDVWGLDSSRTPGEFRVPAFPTLAVDPSDESLYCVYADSTRFAAGNYDVDLYFTRSVDQGVTWSIPRIVRAGGGTPGDQFFPWLDVDEEGRLHLVYYDTRHTAQDDAAPHGWLDAAYASSADGGDTWASRRLTDTSFSSEHDGFGGIFVGDYLGVASAGGRTLPVYMSTSTGNADIFGHLVLHSAATAYCRGFACPCGNVDPLSGCGNAGLDSDPLTGARLTSSGTNFAARDDLQLELSGLRPLAFGLLLSSKNTVSPPFGDGRRCLGGQVYRFPVRRADAAGVMQYGPSEIVSYSKGFAPHGVVAPSATWNYQGWYRDSLGPCGSGFNLTNGLSVTWR